MLHLVARLPAMEATRPATSQQPALSVKPFPIRMSAAAWRKMASSRSRPAASERLAPRLGAGPRAAGLAAIGSRPGTVARDGSGSGDMLAPSTRSLLRSRSPAAHQRPGLSTADALRPQTCSSGQLQPQPGAATAPVMRLPRACNAPEKLPTAASRPNAAYRGLTGPTGSYGGEAEDQRWDQLAGQSDQVSPQLHDLAAFSASVTGDGTMWDAPRQGRQLAIRTKRASWASTEKRPYHHPAALRFRDRRSLSSGRGLEDLAAGIAARLPPPLTAAASGTWRAAGTAGSATDATSSTLQLRGPGGATPRGQASVPGSEERKERSDTGGSTVRKAPAQATLHPGQSPAGRAGAVYLTAEVSGWADSTSPDSQLAEHVMDDLAAEDGGELQIGSLPRTSRSSLGKGATPTLESGTKTSLTSSAERRSRSIRTVRQLNLESTSPGFRSQSREMPARSNCAISPMSGRTGDIPGFARALEGPERTPLAKRLVAAAEVRTARSRNVGDADHWLQISSQGGTIRHLASPKPRHSSKRHEPLVSGSRRAPGSLFVVSQAADIASPISCVVVPRAPGLRPR